VQNLIYASRWGKYRTIQTKIRADQNDNDYSKHNLPVHFHASRLHFLFECKGADQFDPLPVTLLKTNDTPRKTRAKINANLRHSIIGKLVAHGPHFPVCQEINSRIATQTATPDKAPYSADFDRLMAGRADMGVSVSTRVAGERRCPGLKHR